MIAGAATFAAFPVWYATMFSGFYVALLLLLVLLITRIVSFEWRGKAESAAWRGVWTWVNAIASLAIPLDLGHRALEPPARCPDLVGAGVHRHLLGPVHAVHRGRGSRVRAALRAARRGLPRTAHRRRPARPRRTMGGAARGSGSARRRSIRHLDAGRRNRQERQERLSGHRRRRPGRRCRTRRRRARRAGGAKVPRSSPPPPRSSSRSRPCSPPCIPA